MYFSFVFWRFKGRGAMSQGHENKGNKTIRQNEKQKNYRKCNLQGKKTAKMGGGTSIRSQPANFARESNPASSNSRYWVARPIRIEYFKHVTELIHSRPISVHDFMGVSTTCKTTTKSLPTFPRHVRHTKSHVSTNFILTSYLALQSGRVWPPIDVTPLC